MNSIAYSATRAVSRLSNKLRRKLDTLSYAKNLSATQGKILSFLLSRNQDIFQKDIEDEYSMRPSSATQLLKQMEANQLIERIPLEEDHRLKKIVPTALAREYENQVVEELSHLEEELIEGIEEEKLEIFFEVLEHMEANLSQE